MAFFETTVFLLSTLLAALVRCRQAVWPVPMVTLLSTPAALSLQAIWPFALQHLMAATLASCELPTSCLNPCHLAHHAACPMRAAAQAHVKDHNPSSFWTLALASGTSSAASTVTKARSACSLACTDTATL